MDDEILDMIRNGYDTTQKMVCYKMGIPLSNPKDLTWEQRAEYKRIRQRLSHKMQVLRKWHEIEVIEYNSNTPYIWRVIDSEDNGKSL